MKAESYPLFNALAAQTEYPIKIAGARRGSGFASLRNLFDPVSYVFRNVDFFEPRNCDYQPVLYRQGKEYRETEVCHLPVFDGTPDDDVTMEAIREIRSIAGKQCFISGMSALADVSKEYTSFAGAAEGMESSVKFIYRTDSVKAK